MKLKDDYGVVHDFARPDGSWATACGTLFCRFNFVSDEVATTCPKCLKQEEQKNG